MDLFTYLMAKNGNNSSVHGDLFSYLLGKAQGGGGQIKTASGTTIYIPDAKKLVSLIMTKESTQDGEPTPDNPVEIKTVKGYRNLFDKDNTGNLVGYGLSGTNGGVSKNNERNTSYFIELKPNTNYYLSGATFTARVLYNKNQGFIKNVPNGLFTTTEDTKYMRFGYVNTVDYSKIKLTEGDQELPYVPYGNNYIAVNVSDGTNTNNYPIPLNNNEIVGIGDYKDELKVDKSGNVFINKKTGKIIFDGTTNAFNLKSSSVRNIVYLTPTIDNMKSAKVNTEIVPAFCSHFINDSSSVVANLDMIAMGIRIDERINFGFGLSSNLTTLEQANQWLTTQYNNGTPVTTYYPLATPELIDLQTTVDIKLFKGVNNISNSEDGYMTIEYR